MSQPERILNALQVFADAVCSTARATASGDPESRLTTPVQQLLSTVGRLLARRLTIVPETSVGDLGQPDFCVEDDGVLIGFVELKAPGKGADPDNYRGHDCEQWDRFRQIPNLIYTDGSEFGLYRTGSRVGDLLRFSGRVDHIGRRAVSGRDAERFRKLYAEFLAWEPAALPDQPTARDVANLLAPRCRFLREEVEVAVAQSESALSRVARDWRELLFPEADNRRFADAYAQTVTFALLLARAEGAGLTDLTQAIRALSADHALLSKALEVLTADDARQEARLSLRVLQRVIDRLPPDALTRADGHDDPLLYFYEDFLAAYDPELRKNAGVYYTPPQVVHAQVRLVERLLVDRLGRPLGFADSSVITLDPALGTGTYLLGVVERARATVLEQEGPGAIAARISELARQLHGFENMVGPYAVAQLRLSRALTTSGASIPSDGPGIYLTDTLESPYVEPQRIMSWYRVLARDHERALRVKREVPVLVCLGNPPYDRHEHADETNRARTGGWVRWGDPDSPADPILEAFRGPAMNAGHGGDVKNLYNLYVYFWRWALWKVFENGTGGGPGIVSYITAASYLDGDAFVGVREHMRRVCDEVWIIDLGGEGRGTRQEENVFAIRTPVAIAVCARYQSPSPSQGEGRGEGPCPARVHYTRIAGDRARKLARLDAIADFGDLPWENCPADWHAPFRPAGSGPYFTWPQLTDLMPWQHSGVEMKRTWPIAPDDTTLQRRWRGLLKSHDRAGAFAESSDRRVADTYQPIPPDTDRQPAIARLSEACPTPRIENYAFRTLDRQRALIDGRLIARPRAALWHAHSPSQVYLTTFLNHNLGVGAAVTACCHVPDRHHFRGSFGGRDVIPLYRNGGDRPNIAPGLLELLSATFARPVTPEDFVAYVYAVMAHPGFTERFWTQLETRDLRVPLTNDSALFAKAVEIGRRLLWLHTFGERFTSRDRPRGRIPRGRTRCARPVPDAPDRYPESFEWVDGPRGDGTLIVGKSAFAPVRHEVYEFEVSGLKVVQSWLNYRMRRPRNVRKSSPLDDIRPERWTADFTGELLRVLWILEATIETYQAQRNLLERIIEGNLHHE